MTPGDPQDDTNRRRWRSRRQRKARNSRPCEAHRGAAGKARTPAAGNARTPAAGKARTPAAGNARTPAAGNARTPAAGNARTPAAGKARTPAAGNARTPAAGNARTPAAGNARTPAAGNARTPAAGNARTPAAGNARTPAAGNARTPAAGNARTPAAGNARTPAAGNARTPAAGNARTPAAGNARTPAAGNARTPAAGNARTPAAGNARTPAAGNARTPAAGNARTPYPALTWTDVCRCYGRRAPTANSSRHCCWWVTKMVQAQETDASTRRKIFDAVGFTFPNRLLKSAGGPEGDIYRALGVTIFSCFCTDSELVLHHHVTSKIPLFNDIIVEPPGGSDEEQTTHHSMVEDCYQCLLAIGATQAGRAQLIARDSVPVLCQAVIRKMYGYGQAMQIMRQLLAEHGRELWNTHGDALTHLLTAMAKEFTDADDISKFVLCEDLGLLLSGRDKDSGDFLHYTWAEDILNGLSEILGSYIGPEQRNPAHCPAQNRETRPTVPYSCCVPKCNIRPRTEKPGPLSCTLAAYLNVTSGPEQRNPALELASLMLDHLGIEWAMSANVKFVLLLVNLACVEVRMVLEDPDLKQVFQKSALMSACYNILESAIMFTSCTPNSDLPLNPKQIEQFVESLQGAYVGVTFFLAQVAEQPQDTWTHPLVTASVRVLGAWLAEETSALREEVYGLLPFLIKLGWVVLPAVSLSLDDTEDQSKGAAGVSSLSEEMQELDLQTEHEKEQYLPKSGVLSFLLPGLCHLTAEPRPRALLLQLQVHQVLARCLQLHLANFLGTKDHQSEMALRTLCGIFLNLLVLSPQPLTSNPNMAALLNRIMGAVPQLGKFLLLLLFVCCPEHTVLLANFVVMCLMQARGVKDLQETSVTRHFFRTAVEFLGGAYHVTRGGEQKHLSVSPAYSPHWDSISELWFLGMQGGNFVPALVSCIPQLPWLPAIFLETGLLKNVVALLQDIPGGEFDLDTVDLYQNMVVEVAKHDGKCQQWLQQNGGLEVARVPNMTVLASPDDRYMWPYHFSFPFFSVDVGAGDNRIMNGSEFPRVVKETSDLVSAPSPRAERSLGMDELQRCLRSAQP
ncbi:NCDN [Branchiostoma lanceolatum]|uniref:Neurochondrin n=1 Tax=Branchiostoma lanceolatum TaxID=7740 RepID=A0A8K0A3Q9_BRALA|nr:NCDN [Branchiostoma lanceolatum]